MPDKSQKETIKNQLFEQMEVQFLDNFSVYVNLEKGDRYLNIPFLDEACGFRHSLKSCRITKCC